MEGINYFISKFKDLIVLFYRAALILGIGLIMYAGAKYIFNKGKDWHSEIIYIILGVALIIASFSIPVIIFSFLK